MVAGMHRFMVLAGALALGPQGCPKIEIQFEDPKPEPFEVQINVFSDPGVPIPGAQIIVGGSAQSLTDASGNARILSYGHEGDRIDVVVKCPDDYESPDAPLSIGMRKLTKGSPTPHFEVRCPPTRRTTVVGFRVENGPNIPVQYLGRTVARTDSSGAAVFALRLKPAQQVEVSLDTTDAPEGIRPQNPTFTFVAKAVDDFVVFDQTFVVPVKHHAAHVIVGPKPL
jgi:hypothetical protein